MKLYQSVVAILFFMLCEVPVIRAQHAIVISGGQATGTGGNASYSIGQVNYMYIKNTDGSVSQGVQHAFEIFAVEVDTGSGTGFHILVTAYPNPASQFLNLRIDEGKIEDLSYRIVDESGREIAQHKIVDKETTVSLADLHNSLYFVKVYKSIFVMKTFKIVKTK